MKKIMIALAAVACAAAVQAAVFPWGTNTKFTDDKGSVLTTADGYTAALNGGTIVLVLLQDGTYDGAKTVLAGQTAPVIKTTTPTATQGRLNANYNFEYESNVLKNDDVIGVMFQDAKGELSQLVYSSDMKTTVDDTYTIDKLAEDGWAGDKFVYGTGGNFTVPATVAVPEPTSGLLLLLGVAGLSLKRKRA